MTDRSGLHTIAALLFATTTLVTVPPARAALRSPQVPVSGTALSAFFASQGQTIDVNTAQQDIQRFSEPADFTFETHEFGAGPGDYGVYNAGVATPSLYLVFPGGASSGWFTVTSFRDSPARLVVNLFDQNFVIQGSNVYLGADRADFGFYAANASGTVFTEDARNPGGAPRVLAYSATGAREGWTWFACETGAGPGGDFFDVVLLIQLALAPVGVQHTTWGTLKARFR